MSKKWNSRAPSAFSSAIAVLILLSAGAAVAQQGGLQQLAAGAKDAIAGRDHSQLSLERQSELLASPAPTRSHGTNGVVHASGGSVGDSCSSTVAAVRVDMPAAGDTTGIAQALSMLQANCAKNPQALGLINAIQKLGHGTGHTGGPAAPPPSGHTNNGQGDPPSGHTNSGHGGTGSGNPSGHTNSGHGETPSGGGNAGGRGNGTSGN